MPSPKAKCSLPVISLFGLLTVISKINLDSKIRTQIIHQTKIQQNSQSSVWFQLILTRRCTMHNICIRVSCNLQKRLKMLRTVGAKSPSSTNNVRHSKYCTVYVNRLVLYDCMHYKSTTNITDIQLISYMYTKNMVIKISLTNEILTSSQNRFGMVNSIQNNPSADTQLELLQRLSLS